MAVNETAVSTATEELPALQPSEKQAAPEHQEDTGVQEETSSQEEVTFEPLPENWHENPDAKSFLEEQTKAAREEAARETQSSKDREIKELKADHREAQQRIAQEAQGSEIVQKIAEAADALLDALEAGSTAEEAQAQFKKLLRDNAQWAQVFNGASQRTSIQHGENQGMARASQLLQAGLNKDLQTELTEYVKDIALDVRAGDLTIEKGFERVLTKRDDIVREDEKGKLEKLFAQRIEEEGRAEERDGQKPVANVGGRGGSAPSPSDVIRSKATPAEKAAAFEQKHGVSWEGRS